MENRKHTLKRLLSCVAVVVMMLTAVLMSGAMGNKSSEWKSPFALQASAYSENGLDYTVSDGMATITDCSSSISGDLVIPEVLGGYPVTSIGDWVFFSRTKLTSITISNSVTSIGEHAFNGCSGLKSVTIGNSVMNIGDSAFRGCTGFTRINWQAEDVIFYGSNVFENAGTAGNGMSVVFGDNVKSIPAYAFRGCTYLTSVTIGNSVTSIGADAFYGCTGLTKINWNAESVNDFSNSSDIYYNAGTAGIGMDIFFGDNVKQIPAYAFCVNDDSCRPKIKTVAIGNSVTSIGNYAFEKCTGLTSITIPDSVTSIGSSTFCYCTGLTSVKIVNSVTSIGRFAFFNCIGLTSVTIPDSATSIGSRAFGGCTGLASVTIGNSVTSIGSSAFYGCTELTSITIPDSVTSIGSSAFSDCNRLTSVTIGQGVTSIGDSAFRGCSGLTSITIPDSVTSIGSSAFSGCTGLTSITIPDSVTSIGNSAFSFCTGLTKINWNAESVSDFFSDSYVFYKAGTDENGVDIVFGNNVKRIPVYAFRNCTSLTSVTIGNSITSIGSYAFMGCTGLTKIYWNAESVRNLSYDNNVFYKAGTAGTGTDVVFGDNVKRIPAYVFQASSEPKIKSVTIGNSVTSIGDDAFRGCTGLTKINWNAESVNDFSNSSNVFYKAGTAGNGMDIIFGDNVKRIPAYSFCFNNDSYIPKIKSVTIGNSVTSIGDSAFSGSSLRSVTIGNSVTSIGSSAFSSCTGLTSVTIPDCLTSIGDEAFHGCIGLTRINWNAESVSDFSSSGDVFHYAGNGMKVIFGDSVKSIPAYAFRGCTGLTSVTIGNRVTSIGDSAFNGCTSLASITIPNSVTSIGEYAFEGCIGLTKINWNAESVSDFFSDSYVFYKVGTAGNGVDILFGDNVKRIPAYIFFSNDAYGPKIRSVTISNSVTSIGNSAFCGCTELSSVIIGTGATSIGASAFSGCTGLISVTIGNSVTSIGDSAFYSCTRLASITIPGSVTSIGISAFSNCGKLNDVYYSGFETQWKAVSIGRNNECLTTATIHAHAHTHSYTAKVAKAATCTAAGVTTYTCLCGDSYTKSIPATGKHTYKVTVPAKASFKANGKKASTCTVCKKAVTTEIPKVTYFKLSATAYTYNGKVLTPTVTVKDSKGNALKNGTDYTAKYDAGRKNPGKYTVTVILKGNYTGNKSLTFTILPGKTSSLTFTQTESSIKATWKAVTGASGYKVTLYSAKNKAIKTVYTTKTTASFSKLSKGTTYKVRVTAYKTVGKDKLYASAYTQLTTATKPGTPTLSATAGTKKATLKWNKQTGATGYVVYMATSKNGKYTKIATLKGNTKVSYTKTGLTKGKTYYFKVAAYETVGGKNIYGSFSSVKYAKIN